LAGHRSNAHRLPGVSDSSIYINAISNDKVSSDDCSASGRATYKCALLVGNKRQIHITERSQKLDGVYSLLHLPGIR
jgi:hypothetical protein